LAFFLSFSACLSFFFFLRLLANQKCILCSRRFL
jgi:hypothetical protein